MVTGKRVVRMIEGELGFTLTGWQKKLIEYEFPTRLPRKLKKRMKKNTRGVE